MRFATDVVQHYMRAEAETQGAVAYSFCTLVTNLTQYQAMVEGFRRLGFTSADCEFLYIDNSASNQADAFAGYNSFLRQASGRYVILCHQDVMGLEDGRLQLDSLLAALSEEDPHWADTVEKLWLNRLFSRDSLFQVIWEIVGDDGTKEGSASGTFLRVLA